MSKVFAVLVVLAMIVQLIRPLGLPGLRRRGDAWKLALVGLALILAVAVVRPE